MDCSPPGVFLLGISQAGILEWLLFPCPGDLPDQDIYSMSSVLQVDSLPLSHLGSPVKKCISAKKKKKKLAMLSAFQLSSVQFSCSVLTDSLRPHGLPHARLRCPSQLLELAQTHVHQVHHPLVLCRSLLLPSVFPSPGSFPVSHFFTSGGQSTGASASASVLPMNIQD